MENLKLKLNGIKEMFDKEIGSAASSADIERIKVKYLGKKGEMTSVLRGMGSLAPEERPLFGQLSNSVRTGIESVIEERETEIAHNEKTLRLKTESIDVTVPGVLRTFGSRHPISQVIDEINEIFIGLGFTVADGPEIEYDRYNFEMLNTPYGHPARDTQDTFYINEHILLRTQTSPVQIRVMENSRPPIKVVCPGKVYRSDSIDATHSPIFHQYEGLVVDKNVTMGDLTGSLRLFAKRLFGENTEIRLRPHHFPFTEPSCEVDVTCWACGGEGCRTCKGEGWVEVLGAGMVHTKVLENCGIDSEVYSGFAFGIGMERTAMARFGIDDIRNFYENDIRFLSQF
ncbi:MAG: phenylalanine--tRNA ligase subunit alpha [Saccharofermentanales bacterium]